MERETVEEQIESLIGDLEKLLKGKGKHKISDDWMLAKKTLDAKYKDIKNELELYENTYCAGARTKEGKAAKQTYEKFKESLLKLKKDKEAFVEELQKRQEAADKEENEYVAPNPDRKRPQRQKMIEAGDKMQGEALDIVTGLVKETDDQNKMVADMREELLRQREKLLEVHQNAMNMQSTLKKSKDYLMQFTRELYQDKFIRILVLMILVALVAVVIVGIFRKKKSTTSTSTGTTSTNTTSTGSNNTSSNTTASAILNRPSLYTIQNMITESAQV